MRTTRMGIYPWPLKNMQDYIRGTPKQAATWLSAIPQEDFLKISILRHTPVSKERVQSTFEKLQCRFSLKLFVPCTWSYGCRLH